MSALETLTHITTLYLKTLAKTASTYSNASNRTQSNLFDIINALHDLSSIQGFEGASTLHNSENLLKSSVLRELYVFVNSNDEVPFAKPIPRRDFVALPRITDSLGSKLDNAHVPKWLPGFPDQSTYIAREETSSDKRMTGDMVLWENTDLAKHCGGRGDLVLIDKEEIGDCESSKGRSDLAIERPRVRFKIQQLGNREMGCVGLDVRNMLCTRRKRKNCWNENGNHFGEEMSRVCKQGRTKAIV
ncbi:hypothetical protein K2173_014347 [Erythroxylum novogranatense]|uniref:Bromodomain associated domain-containing protein n=1 Tax=Erythroxylum novogranatense TaxID=1862640 RepID=A0AAV8T0U7_9ROSI|nr:hypothetical protein K2173_014347 [Erythroxylum novogranatense]